MIAMPPRNAAEPALFSPLYPRPQLVRTHWASLDGEWEFAYDEELRGGSEHASPFPRTITVPLPPESPSSGIGDTEFHPVVWYRRTVSLEDAEAAGWAPGRRLILNFGAVDYRAEVWVGDRLTGRHEGGHTPFRFDITDVVGGAPWTLTVRAEDDPHDVEQPRGKQDWQELPHGIWYQRTTGIWQTVWLESVPVVHARALHWTSDIRRGTATLELDLGDRPAVSAEVSLELEYDGETLGTAVWTTADPRSAATVTLAGLSNGQQYESLLWSPDHPRLIEATIRIRSTDGVDLVRSYLGLRTIDTVDGHVMVNDRPCFIRAVLAQGYWPLTHLASPGPDSLEREARLVTELGFNAVRIHQKIEDPRFLMWADLLGILVWEEAPSHYGFSSTAVARLTREWIEVVDRDRSHPSIVTWVPLNESWGVQHIAHDPAQLHYAQGLFHLTKALDPTRPVVSNDGWEHADSDLMTIHDYAVTGSELTATYVDRGSLDTALGGLGPLGRRLNLLDTPRRGQPVIVSEFGGISYAPSHPGVAWGYLTTHSPEEFELSLRELFTALHSSPILAGFCYTQLTDTAQEANGLCGADRIPKIDAEVIAAIVRGDGVDTSSHLRPKKPVERPHQTPAPSL